MQYMASQEQANKEARAAAQAVSSNPKDLSLAALRKDINERERRCKDMLHQHRFIRQTVTRSGCKHLRAHMCRCLPDSSCGLS